MLKRLFMQMVFAALILISQLRSQEVLDKIAAVVEEETILSSELTQFSLNIAFQIGLDPRKDVQ